LSWKQKGMRKAKYAGRSAKHESANLLSQSENHDYSASAVGVKDSIQTPLETQTINRNRILRISRDINKVLFSTQTACVRYWMAT